MHLVYMAKPGRKPRPKQDKPLRWRANCIGAWRERARFTQQKAADALEQLGLDPRDLVDSHASIGRIESGDQMPSIGLVEGMVRLYGAPDIDSLLNREPTAADAEPPQTTAGLLQLWDKATPKGRGLMFEMSKRIVQTDT